MENSVLNLADKRYIIGIDLGTTNSAISYVDLHDDSSKKNRINIFKIPQLTGQGEVNRLPVLPSFLYIPGKYDIDPDALKLPWTIRDDHVVGTFAREQGAKVPAKLVSSAKSWLCHGNVDRNSRILPWGAGDGVRKVSPVQATAAYLEHIKRAWNSYCGDDDDRYLENQLVIITVPASFDEVARDLTMEAAALAGISGVTLIEEPLAAFYSWLIRNESRWSDFVKPGDLILVCDVGGGTTDFTLITLREVDGSPRFERIAVGDHLILGGDNVDLALASRVEGALGRKQVTLSGDRWKTLCHQCRQAKEAILDGTADSRKITIMGEGSRLIGGTISAEIDRDTVEDTVVEGFFPLVKASGSTGLSARKGITEFGLPYEQEPAITRHLGMFLERHQDDVRQVLGREHKTPDLILFNGGSLKPAIIQDRIREAIRYWFQDSDQNLPRVLVNPDPDLAVALGASYYGLVKTGIGVKVGSGSPRAYYLGVARMNDESGTREKPQAICLVERGLDEGSEIGLNGKKFTVLANQPVSFDVYSSSYRSGDRCGDLLDIDDTFTRLPPIQTVVQYGKKGEQTSIPVRIEATYTEMGTLALWCRSLVSHHRWQLQFQLRDRAEAIEVTDREVFDEDVVAEACSLIDLAFTGNGNKLRLDNLVKDLAGILERPKERWPLGFIRKLSDEMLRLINRRSVSPELESRWLNLTGFCLRPGFGDALDEHRIKSLLKIHRQGPVFLNNAQVRKEWWIMWRRVAAGLKPGQQRQFIQELTPTIMPKKGNKPRVPAQERLEIWMAVANMENLLINDKVKWGRQLLSEIKPKKCRPQHLWSLSRIGARELLYGPADRVIAPDEAASWIDTIMGQSWRNPKPVGAAVAQLGRRTGDRVRDLDEAFICRVVDWLRGFDMFESELRFLTGIVPMNREEETLIFGESLPAGLVLHTE